MNHHARLETSLPLQRIKEALLDGQWHTSLELAIKTGTVCIGARCAELRSNGLDIECRYKGKSASGNKIYEYRLVRETHKEAA